MKLTVHSGFGIETATKLELRRLGIDAPAENGRFSFDGTAFDIARLNLCLRTADRVSIVAGEFLATTFDGFFDGVKNIPWADYCGKHTKVIVNAKSVESTLFALSALQSVGKKAIVTKLAESYGTLDESGEELRVEFALYKDKATVLIDTSGSGLHKRGYRDLVYEAPVKETIAAAIIELSVWNPSRPFADPFCGSGTFPIEAALIAKNIPSGYFREFLFENYSFIDKKHIAELRKEAKEAIVQDPHVEIFGGDINERAIELAAHHAQNAEVADIINFRTADARAMDFSSRRGVIACNPPYGERLLKEKEVRKLYAAFGKSFRKLPDWSLYLLTAYADFENAFGQKADKARKIYNATLPCRVYRYLAQAPAKKEKNNAH